MAALPYMQLYVADYLADTAYLDVIESGAYLHLIMNYWQTGKPLPDDDKKLARIAKCTDEQWLNVRSTVVEYFIEQDGKLFHNRIDADLLAVSEKQTAASKAGKASAESRKRRKTPVKTNERSTDAEQSLNGCPTNVEQTNQRTLNHTDTDTDTDTEVKKQIGSRKRDVFVPPDWVPPDQWAAYLKSRREKKHPMNTNALDLCIKSIEKCRGEGWPVDQIFDQMIAAGWRSVKADWMGNSHQSIAKNGNGRAETHQERGERMAREREARMAGNITQGVISEQ